MGADQSVENHPEAPDVGLCARRLIHHDLGCHESCRTRSLDIEIIWCDLGSESKVPYLHSRHFCSIAHENVEQFEIAMNKPGLVNIAHALCHLNKDMMCALLRHPIIYVLLFHAVVEEVPALRKLCY